MILNRTRKYELDELEIDHLLVSWNALYRSFQVDAFRVDGIPHLAMVNAKGDVETAIIGNVPKEVNCYVGGSTLLNKETKY